MGEPLDGPGATDGKRACALCVSIISLSVTVASDADGMRLPLVEPRKPVPNHAIWQNPGRVLGGRGMLSQFPHNPSELFQLDFGASAFELALDLLSFVLSGSFLDRVRRTVHKLFSFLEAEARNATNFLNDSNLIATNRR